MTIMINPGSENKGGTIEQSRVIAEKWLKSIHDDGFLEVELLPDVSERDGLWMYTFRHCVTGVTATLDTHGFTDEQCEAFMFQPRIYWNGSSTSDPEISDWLTDGWNYRIEFYQGEKQ